MQVAACANSVIKYLHYFTIIIMRPRYFSFLKLSSCFPEPSSDAFINFKLVFLPLTLHCASLPIIGDHSHTVSLRAYSLFKGIFSGLDGSEGDSGSFW